jgi:enamine deaminase RidA (YjgF/YER057c/UK114 family)
MNYRRIEWDDLPVKLCLSTFDAPTGDSEYHLIIEITDNKLPANEQFNVIRHAIERFKESEIPAKSRLAWKRYFISDAANQYQLIQQSQREATSVIQQPPLNGTKLSLLAYFADNITVSRSEDGTGIMQRPSYTHLFNTQICETTGNASRQTQSIFSQYINKLENHQCCLEANCIRTWIFVQNIDIQYGGMVEARKELFKREGMTPETHFIASTGIEGRHCIQQSLVLLDGYAIREIKKQQVIYLHGSSHLNPTHHYGVTFERGTVIQYGDRRHTFISGTASIDSQGAVVHPLDIEKQTCRTMENIRTLLHEAGADFEDIAHMIIYLRDTADYETVKMYFEQNHPQIPKVILSASVCRPEWLIEVECMAVKASYDSRYNPF